MVGVVIIALVLVVAIPVAVLMSGAVASAVLGALLKRDTDQQHEGSELLELS